ncbi:MAG: hypothetical protein V1831_03255 [Candidatus Woesearchaeota archaeon]
MILKRKKELSLIEQLNKLDKLLPEFDVLIDGKRKRIRKVVIK